MRLLMASNIIQREDCPVCFEDLFLRNEICSAHAPSDTSCVHAICMRCFDLIRAQNQGNTIQCPLCRQDVPFTEGRIGDVIPVDLPRAVVGRPRAFEGNIDHAFARAIALRDVDQARDLLLNPELSERVIEQSFRNVTEVTPFPPDEVDQELANIIYSSNRLDQEYIKWVLRVFGIS